MNSPCDSPNKTYRRRRRNAIETVQPQKAEKNGRAAKPYLGDNRMNRNKSGKMTSGVIYITY